MPVKQRPKLVEPQLPTEPTVESYTLLIKQLHRRRNIAALLP